MFYVIIAIQIIIRLDIRSISLARELSNTGTAFLEGGSMPQTYYILRVIWSVPLIHALPFG